MNITNIMARFLLFIFILYSHVFILLNDGQYWDGAMIAHNIEIADWEFLKEFYLQLGRPVTYYLLYFLSTVSDNFIFIYRVVVFLCAFLVGFSLFNISRKTLKLDVWQSWFVSAFTASWPFYSVFISTIFLDYILSFALFYFAWALLFYSQRERAKIAYFISILLLSATCYTINSLLVYYYGFVAILYVTQNYKLESSDKIKSIITNFITFAKRHWLILILPILTYIAKSYWNTPYGAYEGYNGIKYDIIKLVRHIIYGIQHDFLYITRFISIDVIKLLWPAFLVGGIIYVCAIRKIHIKNIALPSLSKIDNNRTIFLLAAILIIFAILPYAVVGKYAYGGVWWGWGTRHLALQPFGHALLFVAIISHIQSKTKRDLSIYFFSLCFWILFSFSSVLIYNYISWQSRAVIELSVIKKLQKIDPPKSGTYILYDLPTRHSLSVYRKYGINSILYRSWKKEEWFGVHLQNINKKNLEQHLRLIRKDGLPILSEYKSKENLSRDFRFNGCVSKISVKLIDDIGKASISLRYYYYKIFGNKEEEDNFLSNIVEVSMAPLEKEEQPNCNHFNKDYSLTMN